MLSKKKLGDYRNGAVGALTDEYEKALSELKSVLQTVSEADYSRLVEGEDKHCCSV